MKMIRLIFAVLLCSAATTTFGAAEDLPWSFKPLKNSSADFSRFENWAFNDIDPFIAAALESKGLRPNQNADRRTLIRRAAFDLTGLPPTRAELDRFLRNPASDETVFAEVIDHYLASEKFGERWGRHWLDVARYADSVGRTWNAPFVYAWRYRDWVIDSFNRDKPYHRFVAEQIAGDLLPAASVKQRRDQVIGTGFLTLGSLTINSGGNEQFVLDQVDDQIDVTTRGFLGLSVACARCHDHKYDPVSQKDYYALAGIFYSSWTYSGTPHMSNHAGYGYVDPEMLVRLPEDTESKIDRVRSVPSGIHSMSDLRQFGGKPPPPFKIMSDWAMGMRDGKPVNCALRKGGVVWDRGPAPPRGDLRIAGLPDFPVVPDDASGRIQLAQWIASPENPLTARVMVNRIWQHLFGKGLVETVDNFGLTGREPSHPELLDALAIRFAENGWSIKATIRHIMMSRTYRLSGEQQEKGFAVDPGNTFYWRSSPRRLELEPLRDTLLFVSGNLLLNRPLPGTLAGHGGKGKSGTRSEIDFTSPCRTIYLPVLRDLLPDEFGVFDFPDPSSVNGLRHVTTAPPQALFFLNSGFVSNAAYDTARRILEQKKGDSERIDLAYETILSRRPDSEEKQDALKLMRGLDPGNARDPEAYRWSIFIQGLFAGTEFRYVF